MRVASVSPTEQRTIPIDRARQGLAWLWLGYGGGIFLLLVAQSLAGKYEGEVQEVWGWALPTIIPTLSLILAVLGAGALQPGNVALAVRRTFYVIALWLSAIYLTLILATILAEPLTASEPLALLKLSSLWLAPFQGLVTSAIGILFTRRPAASARVPRKARST
jgi:hypothetical protein